ncbi:MAG: hypothetical protein IT562_10875 [Alphaproteobacteria bacterium]|nr:hypothetical protein [Alphaproteobacteria bacterium]
MTAAAGPLSLISLGLSAGSTLVKGAGEKAAADFKAAQAERAAEYGRVQADLTDTSMRENLRTTLGNIDAIRAAGFVDPTSPTTAAIEDRQTQLSDRARTAKVGSIRAQAADDQAGADYLRQMGDYSLLAAGGGAAAKLAGGFGKGNFGFGSL